MRQQLTKRVTWVVYSLVYPLTQEVAAATVEGAMAAEVELLAEAGAAGGAAAQMPEVAVA